jgi:hypothetical protein
MNKMSRRIVVDASIARAAGTKENPVSTRCREFLTDMLTICHRLVITKDIEAEWKKHMSRFTASWLVAMQSRGKICRVNCDENEYATFIDQVNSNQKLTNNQRSSILKDSLLVIAAWNTDSLVASGDDTMRGLLASLTGDISGLKRIIWINPSATAETPRDWLAAGARSDRTRRLGDWQP